jgi:molybdopterin converting factor subunit 1
LVRSERVKIRVLYFANVRERLHLDGEDVELPPNTNVGEVRERLAALHPEIAALLPRVGFAVNRSMARNDHELADGDEVATIPPVAGGAGEVSEARTC